MSHNLKQSKHKVQSSEEVPAKFSRVSDVNNNNEGVLEQEGKWRWRDDMLISLLYKIGKLMVRILGHFYDTKIRKFGFRGHTTRYAK